MINILQPTSFNSFYKQVERVFSEVRLPFLFSKYSNKLYNNFVHVYLLILKERHKCSYRRLTELLNDITVLRLLGIQKQPHFTTLQKVVSRISKNILQKLVMACHKLINSKNMIVAVDSTGFTNINPTYYCLNKCGIRPPYKNFTQTSIIVDTDTKLVLFVTATTQDNQQKQVILTVLTYNLEKLSRNKKVVSFTILIL